MNLFSFIKERVQVLDVIQEHIALKKAGNYWKGSCPFHNEKTASFTVSPHRGIFYCFGCQETGDVISFISKMEHCTQVEAAKQLAERYNLELPETISYEATETIDEKKRYFGLCEAVAHWCHTELIKHPSILNYLEKRGFSQVSISTFKIGYFPSGERAIKALAKEVAQEQFLIKDLLDAGIVAEGKVLYSPFEQRLMFPIKDHLGRFCGFGGRIVKNNDERSKYYNSKENPHFQKGSLLFGLDSAKKEIQKKEYVFLVEGYTDCIAMAQHGYRNTVATLGTACTVEHLKLLAQHAQTVYVMFDGDPAGQKAMLRLAELCWQVELELKVIFLPESHDPASYLQHHKDLITPINQSQDILVFFLETLGKEYATQPLQQKLTSIRSFLTIVSRMQDLFKQDIILQKASHIFDLPFNSLKQEMARAAKTISQTLSPEIKQESIKTYELSVLEKKFLCALLNHAYFLEKEEVERILYYMPEPIQQIITKYKQATRVPEGNPFTTFFDTLEYHEKRMVNEVLVSQEEPEETFDQLLILLEKQYWKTIVNETKNQLAHAEAKNDKEEIQKIVTSFLELKKKLLRKELI